MSSTKPGADSQRARLRELEAALRLMAAEGAALPDAARAELEALRQALRAQGEPLRDPTEPDPFGVRSLRR